LALSVAVAQGAATRGAYPRSIGTVSYFRSLLSAVSFVWFRQRPSAAHALALPPEVLADTQRCLDIMRWAEPANLIALGLMRASSGFGLAASCIC